MAMSCCYGRNGGISIKILHSKSHGSWPFGSPAVFRNRMGRNPMPGINAKVAIILDLPGIFPNSRKDRKSSIFDVMSTTRVQESHPNRSSPQAPSRVSTRRSTAQIGVKAQRDWADCICTLCDHFFEHYCVWIGVAIMLARQQMPFRI